MDNTRMALPVMYSEDGRSYGVTMSWNYDIHATIDRRGQLA